MKVLLLKDVYKLGHAGDVKKVADGYARNYLIPQGLVTMATPGAIKQADQIKQKADAIRSQLNTEMSSLFEKIDGMVITFASKAGETGKLYGSITPQMIVDAINEKSGASIEKRQLEVEPIRTLGEHHVTVRLTVDIVPTVKVIVHREGEKVNLESLVTEEPEKAE
ncbi:MAG TPA: 50S ribosomal protein L9 [Flexilinea sp.]|jgi:large subunit ribosomal protein L9|nr:MAG: 50S ribosomal protein L9 [Chloroflexi bacterium ADurb.Bin344]HNY20412.1 50S ribosomal protein L9 [Flexilinea sp.]HNY94602.1 50S ribosomal protein L9 [Flexilinea sp.]HOG21952.1 50S ribosomal protein L9 [Flexilinea sp.]HOG61500.1 50S ribosomal protein L9 [Flexilinea sp.]